MYKKSSCILLMIFFSNLFQEKPTKFLPDLVNKFLTKAKAYKTPAVTGYLQMTVNIRLLDIVTWKQLEEVGH